MVLSRNVSRKLFALIRHFQLMENVWIFLPKKPKGFAKKLVDERFRGPFEVILQEQDYRRYILRGEVPLRWKKIVNHQRLKKDFERQGHLDSFIRFTDQFGSFSNKNVNIYSSTLSFIVRYFVVDNNCGRVSGITLIATLCCRCPPIYTSLAYIIYNFLINA